MVRPIKRVYVNYLAEGSSLDPRLASGLEKLDQKWGEGEFLEEKKKKHNCCHHSFILVAFLNLSKRDIFLSNCTSYGTASSPLFSGTLQMKRNKRLDLYGL